MISTFFVVSEKLWKVFSKEHAFYLAEDVRNLSGSGFA
jgi:hypothetical protein